MAHRCSTAGQGVFLLTPGSEGPCPSQGWGWKRGQGHEALVQPPTVHRRPHCRAGGRSQGKGRGAQAGVAQSSINLEPAASPGLSNTHRAPAHTVTDCRAEQPPAPVPPPQPPSPAPVCPQGLASSRELLGRVGCGVPAWFPRLQLPPEPSAAGGAHLGLTQPSPSASRGSWQRWHSQTLRASREGSLPKQCQEPWKAALNHPILQVCHTLCTLSHPRRRQELPLRPKAAHPQPKGASGTATLLGRRARTRAASSSSSSSSSRPIPPLPSSGGPRCPPHPCRAGLTHGRVKERAPKCARSARRASLRPRRELPFLPKDPCSQSCCCGCERRAGPLCVPGCPQPAAGGCIGTAALSPSCFSLCQQ